MQVACNRTAEAHPSGFVASSMEAQAHTSCNRHAGYYVSGTIIRGTLKTPNSQLVTPISIKLLRPDGCD
jgi:hypothetical protein